MEILQQKCYTTLRNAANYYDRLFILLLFISIVILRYSTFFYPYPINPDEALMLSNAMRMSHLGVGWHVAEGGTSGPLNPAILMLPKLFGIEITFFTTRLIAAILLSITAAFVYLNCRLFVDKLLSTVITYPLILIYGATRAGDFIHYSSEIFPVALIVVSLYFSLKLYINFKSYINKKIIIYLLGLFLGAVPYCKLQGVLLATTIAFFVIYLFYKNRNEVARKKLVSAFILFLFGIVTTCLFFTATAIYTDSFEYFYLSYIKSNITYQQPWLNIKALIFVKYIPYAELLFGLIPLFFIFVKKNKATNLPVAIYIAALFFISYFTAMKPGMYFHHYLIFATPFFMLLPVSLLSTQKTIYTKRTKLLVSFTILTLLALSIYRISYITTKDVLSIKSTTLNDSIKASLSKNLTYPFITKENEKIYVWGWMTEVYANNRLIPATRNITIYPFLVNLNNDFFKLSQKIVTDEIVKNKPEIIIDAVNGKSFGYNDPSVYGISKFPTINNIVEKNYSEVSTKFNNPQCEKLYLRNDIFNDRVGKIVIPSKIKTSSAQKNFSATNLFDLKVQESICDTFWLPKHKDTLPSVTIYFEKEEQVDKIYILNTTCSSTARCAADEIKVKLFYDNNTVFDEKINILPYPLQTEIKIGGVVADQAIIEIISNKGEIGGLNEVTFMRE